MLTDLVLLSLPDYAYDRGVYFPVYERCKVIYAAPGMSFLSLPFVGGLFDCDDTHF
jgi:hypothetical protein